MQEIARLSLIDPPPMDRANRVQSGSESLVPGPYTESHWHPDGIALQSGLRLPAIVRTSAFSRTFGPVKAIRARLQIQVDPLSSEACPDSRCQVLATPSTCLAEMPGLLKLQFHLPAALGFSTRSSTQHNDRAFSHATWPSRPLSGNPLLVLASRIELASLQFLPCSRVRAISCFMRRISETWSR